MFGKRCTERLSRPSRRREGRREHVGKGSSGVVAQSPQEVDLCIMSVVLNLFALLKRFAQPFVFLTFEPRFQHKVGDLWICRVDTGRILLFVTVHLDSILNCSTIGVNPVFTALEISVIKEQVVTSFSRELS